MHFLWFHNWGKWRRVTFKQVMDGKVRTVNTRYQIRECATCGYIQQEYV